MKRIIWKGPRDLQTLERRRLQAAKLFAACVHQAEVARRLGARPSSVNCWHRVWRAQWEEGLKRKASPGQRSQL
ncbi:MAG: hypothetical protein GTN78_07835 [Gemmatimonadales bacterium]|nr:hypothetical protein [Gemmatimonadales bacterium]